LTGRDPRLSAAALVDVPPDRLYRIVQLRSVVFVLERECPFRGADFVEDGIAHTPTRLV
jgi:predicted GNAT family N-acyltransferase